MLNFCPTCHTPLWGTVGGMRPGYDPPQFCINCGAAMPWISRRGLLWGLENILDEQWLSGPDRLMAQRQLKALRDLELSEDEQARRWAEIKDICPPLIDAGKPFILAVTSEALQMQLGLK